jgi:cyclophilin family peptidyl-prolyl cis-trans isomerase
MIFLQGKKTDPDTRSHNARYSKKRSRQSKKPLNPKKRAIQTTRKRESRGRIYLAVVVIVIAVVAVGWYVYSSAQSTPGDFVLAAPTGVTIHAGSPTTEMVNITAMNHFDSTVQLSATGSSGLTATISPTSVKGSGSATLTLSAKANGTYTVTINATSGSLKHSATPVVDTPVYATLLTSNGTIVVELYRAQTPKTVSNFVSLAQSGFYSNLVWHRIVPSNPAVIQTGDPNTRYGNTSRSTWGTGGSPQTVPLEIDPTLHNDLGYLGMARGQDPNSGSSQFYINMANNNYLDGQYTVFGKVIGPMTAANAIWNTPIYTSGQYLDQPINPVFLISVTISQ